jgi:hypothetical protein
MFSFDNRDQCGESMAKSSKSLGLNALQELHRIFQASDVTEKELLKTALRIRRELVAKEYGLKT